MDEACGYCGCGSEIESVSDVAKIANMVMTGEDRRDRRDRRGMKSVSRSYEKDNVESNMKPRFLADRLGIMGLVEGRERGG